MAIAAISEAGDADCTKSLPVMSVALARAPEGRRHVFCLAQSCRDAGRMDEEAWSARLREARCCRRRGDDGAFLRSALAACGQRPHRAEPLHHVARYHRERGLNAAAAMVAGEGLALDCPADDKRLIDGFVYRWGLREELSSAGNHGRDPTRRARVDAGKSMICGLLVPEIHPRISGAGHWPRLLAEAACLVRGTGMDAAEMAVRGTRAASGRAGALDSRAGSLWKADGRARCAGSPSPQGCSSIG